jgi:hypothetical protein
LKRLMVFPMNRPEASTMTASRARENFSGFMWIKELDGVYKRKKNDCMQIISHLEV